MNSLKKKAILDGVGGGCAALITQPFFAAFVVLTAVFFRPSWAAAWSWWPLFVGAVLWFLPLAIGALGGSFRAFRRNESEGAP